MITIIQLQQGQHSRKCNTYISPEKGQTVETLELFLQSFEENFGTSHYKYYTFYIKVSENMYRLSEDL